MSRRRRGLTDEDRALWNMVAGRVERRQTPRFGDLPKPPETPKAKSANGAPAPAPLAPFRIGETAQTAAPRHDLAPTVRQSLGRAPLNMDRGTHRKMQRGKMAPDARIDLHGMTLDRAQGALTGFLMGAHAQGRRLVLVITGKGSRGVEEWPIPTKPGALKRQVPVWLHRPPLSGIVQQVSPAHRRHGGDGAFYVYLRRAR